jgi:hypothetical protein
MWPPTIIYTGRVVLTGVMEMQDPPDMGSPREAAGCDVYETDDGRVVLYDDRNPDAYLRSDLEVTVER